MDFNNKTSWVAIKDMAFGTVDLDAKDAEPTLIKECVFTGNISNSSTATATFTEGGTNGRVLKEIFIEDYSPGARPSGSRVEVLAGGTTMGWININEDPHYYFKGWENNNKSFAVRTITLGPNATYGGSTVDVMAEYFYK